MVTLRAYSNPAEAALAKSLLDDHDILCSLADENAFLYGGAPLAMPVRILVADEQAEAADQVLKNADGHLADIDLPNDNEVRHLRQQSPAKNNPWEILALASLLVVPGAALLLQKQDLVLVAWKRYKIARLTSFSPATAHLFGVGVIAMALLLVILFFYVREEIKRDQIAASQPQR
jgi:Putative prokaryotic signal transducing protein